MSLAADRARLLELLRQLSFERRKVMLASGKESDFYVDCKRTALTAEGHVLVGRLPLRPDPPASPAGARRGRAHARRRPAGERGGADRASSSRRAGGRLHRAQGAEGARHRPVDRGAQDHPRRQPRGGARGRGHHRRERRSRPSSAAAPRGSWWRAASRWSTGWRAGARPSRRSGVPLDCALHPRGLPGMRRRTSIARSCCSRCRLRLPAASTRHARAAHDGEGRWAEARDATTRARQALRPARRPGLRHRHLAVARGARRRGPSGSPSGRG